MNNFIKIFFLLSFFSCNQPKEKTAMENQTKIETETTTQPAEIKSKFLKRVRPTNGRFVLNDLTNQLSLIFGVGDHESNSDWEDIDQDDLMGFINYPTEEERTNLQNLIPQRLFIHPQNDSLPICRDRKTIFIPLSSNEDRVHITKWNFVSEDSIEFEKLLNPPIEKRYSNIVSMDLIGLDKERFFTIYLKGGEGGENWDEMIIAKIVEKEAFEILAREGVGYCHDCGNWAKISLKINPNSLEMIEVRDSMKLANDQWESVWQKKTRLKKIKL